MTPTDEKPEKTVHDDRSEMLAKIRAQTEDKTRLQQPIERDGFSKNELLLLIMAVIVSLTIMASVYIITRS